MSLTGSDMIACRIRELGTLVVAALLSGCGGESVREIAPCRAAWQEIVIPSELKPFYPGAAVWHSGRLFLLRYSASSPLESRELGLIYDPARGFSTMSEADVPLMDINVAAIATGDAVVFFSYADQYGSYEVTTDTWSALPDPPRPGTTSGAVAMGQAMMVAHSVYTDEVARPLFLTYRPGDADWTVTADPPVPDLRSPALVWTGDEVIAWGGMTEPLSVGARYDPDLDAWTPMADDGAPASLNPPPSRLGVWTGDAAVFWDWFQDGARYYPKEDRWLPVSPSPGGVLGREAVVGRGRVITWTISTLAVYHPGDDAWFTPSMRCGPTPRYRPLLTWVDNGVILWGGSAICEGAADPGGCDDAELQRAFYLHESALFGDVRDERDCFCPPPLGAP
jgi:hypothetical protein